MSFVAQWLECLDSILVIGVQIPPMTFWMMMGKKYFDINETPGHGGHSEIYTIKRYVLPGFQLAESSLNRDSPCQGALRTMITTPA